MLDILTYHSPAMILAQYLQDIDFFTNPEDSGEWPVFVTHLPDTPDDASVITDTTALRDGRMMRTGEVIIHPGIQILVRSKEHEKGFSISQLVLNALQSCRNENVDLDENSYSIKNVSPLGSVLPLGLDKGTKRRFLFSTNYIMTIANQSES